MNSPRRDIIRSALIASGVLAGASGAMAQSVIANGTNQVANGTYNAGASSALYAYNNGTITSAGPLTLTSSGAYAVQAANGGQITIGSPSIAGSTLNASGSNGLSASGSSSRITAWSTAVTFLGADMFTTAVPAQAGAQIELHGGSVKSTGSPNAGLSAKDGATISTDGTAVSDVGTRYGAYAETGGVLNLTGGALDNNTGATVCPASFTTCGAVYLLGSAESSVTTLNADGVAITTHGENRTGVRLDRYTRATFKNGSVTTTGLGGNALYVSGMTTSPEAANGVINATGTRISTGGDSAWGVHIGGGTTTLTRVTVNTSGASSYGILAANGSDSTHHVIGTIHLSDSTVTTTGANAYGVYAWAGGVVNMTGGKVSTSGDGAIGVISAFADGVTGAQLTADGVKVTTSGQNAPGAYVLRGSAALNLKNGTAIEARGAGSPALYAAMAGSGAVTAQDSSLKSGQSNGVYVATYMDAQTQTEASPGTLTLALNHSTLDGAAAWSVTRGNTLALTADSTSKITGAALLDATSAARVTLNGAHWTITGNSRLTTLANNGAIVMSGGAAKTLTVTGDYTGGNGAIAMSGPLNGGAADQLIVNGSASGTTAITYSALSAGAATSGDGILVVQTNGTTSDAFQLKNAPLVAGGYQYTLGRGTDNPNNWYLRGEPVKATGTITSVPALGEMALALLALLLGGAALWNQRKRS